MLSQSKDVVRSVDVARMLDVSKPSVHKALSILESEGYIKQDYYAPIKLTKKGEQYGKTLDKRFDTICKFMTEYLGVEQEEATIESHRIEHALSFDTVNKILVFMDSLDKMGFEKKTNVEADQG